MLLSAVNFNAFEGYLEFMMCFEKETRSNEVFMTLSDCNDSVY